MTPGTDLENLATRLEQAGPESQAEFLLETWKLLNKDVLTPGVPFVIAIRSAPDAVWCRWKVFSSLLCCSAYLSAAEMLVEPGESYIIGKLKGDELAEAMLGSENKWHEAKTPALALAAACVRASLQRDER